MTPIRIGYNKFWALVMLAIAAGGFVLFAMTGSLLQLALGAMFVIAAALWATRPFLVVTDTEIQAKNMTGITLRRFPHGGLAAIDVVPGGIVIGAGEKRQHLRLSRLVVSRADLDKLAAVVESVRAGAGAT